MLPSGSVQIRKEASAPVKTESMNVFSALHPIDDSSDHDGKINEDAAHTHEPLRGGMHSAGDKFSHTSAPQKSLICLSRQAAGIIFHILPRTIKSQGRSERRLCSRIELMKARKCAILSSSRKGGSYE